MEIYGYIGMIDNKVKILIQLPWVPIYTNTKHLIEVETNNKMKTLIPQSQSLVAVSGYRVDKLFEMAYHRLSTIAIGTSLCIFITMVFCPIWAGSGLHDLIVRNLEKLVDSLDDDKTKLGNEEDPSKRMQGFKCVLNSKATKEVMFVKFYNSIVLANLARWEPAHGRFNFRHPWKQYLKIGTSMRKCAYCIEALNSCINSKIQVKHFGFMHHTLFT
ncbi:aluminum-activated malate transporter 10 [Quercus suber]|uniref:Aluminum-activated malate transporter 10 n=1 Tax=Quercus suber TaxID=58331 RepID=A0AAW0KN02_QUESU